MTEVGWPWLTALACPLCEWSLTYDLTEWDLAGVDAALEDHMSDVHDLEYDAAVDRLSAERKPHDE